MIILVLLPLLLLLTSSFGANYSFDLYLFLFVFTFPSGIFLGDPPVFPLVFYGEALLLLLGFRKSFYFSFLFIWISVSISLIMDILSEIIFSSSSIWTIYLLWRTELLSEVLRRMAEVVALRLESYCLWDDWFKWEWWSYLDMSSIFELSNIIIVLFWRSGTDWLTHSERGTGKFISLDRRRSLSW